MLGVEEAEEAAQIFVEEEAIRGGQEEEAAAEQEVGRLTDAQADR